MELLDDGTALKSLFPDSEIESHILDITKEATIYRVLDHIRGLFDYWVIPGMVSYSNICKMVISGHISKLMIQYR